METKDYQKKVSNIKNEILDEIREIIQADTRHEFTETFYIHYVDGDLATSEVCHAVEVWSDETVAFCVSTDISTTKEKEDVMEESQVYNYEVNSFIDILYHLKSDIRKNKINKIIEIVSKNDGLMQFDGSFEFWRNDKVNLSSDSLSHSRLIGISLYDNGMKLVVSTKDVEDNTPCESDQNCITDEELDRILEYVEQQSVESFRITAKEVLSRTFYVDAKNYEDALQKVRQKLICAPLNGEDSGGIEFS